jgi:NAD(P)-dependent dehydrogenase (short-subunit alcohol dehydrogenase family)
MVHMVSSADSHVRQAATGERTLLFAPRDIGRAAVWLASDDSDYIHCATIFVDGGMTLNPGFETGG